MPTVRFVRDQILDIHELEVISAEGQYGQVRKVVLKTNSGDIVYKPFKTVDDTAVVSGFNIKWKSKELLDLSELPPTLWALNKRVEKGICKVRLGYFLWSGDEESSGREVKFMKRKQVDAIEFLDVEEQVEDGDS